MKDFFISYNKADRNIALWIAQQLRSHGYSAIIQAEDMPPGSNFVREMDNACKEAAQVILVLSPDYLKSAYTQPEWHAFFSKDPTGDKRLLVPVRVRDCQLDGLLAQIVYIDLAGKDGDAAAEALLEGIQLSRTESQLPVRFPVDELIERYCKRLEEKVSRVYLFGEEQSRPLDQVFVELTINEDYERRPNQAEFLGLMDAELRKMRSVFGDADEHPDRMETGEFDRAIAKPKRTIKPDELLRPRTHAVITGAPGCGKTTLLRYLAWQTLKQWQALRVPPSGGDGGAAAPRLAREPLPPEGGTPNARFPVFLELKQLIAADFQPAQLEDLLFKKAIDAAIKPRDEAERAAIKQYFLDLLRAGRVAIFLDGLDEVSGASFFKDLQTAVQEFLQSAYGGNTVILSTRPYALRQIGDAKMMEIQPLSPRQIEQFIEHYYRDVPERQQFQRELQRRRELRELARVPALLGFILQLWRKRGSVTDDRLELYAQIALELAQQLDSEKEGIAPEREWLVEDKTGSLKLDLLRQLAFNQLFKGLIRPPYDISGGGKDVDRLVFTSEQLRAEAAEFARTLKEREGLTINPRNLAEDVKATALLRQVGADHFAFAHLTLQEYLAASVLARRDDCMQVFCRAHFNSSLAEMEALPMALGLVSSPEFFYEELEQLPESLNYTNLRLRGRGLGYGAQVSQLVVETMADRLVDFVAERRNEEAPYRDLVVRAFAKSNKCSPIVERITLLLDSVDCGNYENRCVRSNAVEALGQFGIERAIPILIKILRDESSYERGEAAKALGEIGSEQAVPILIRVLGDEDNDIVKNAVEALGKIGSEQAVPALAQVLRGENEDVVKSAAKALGEIGGDRAIPFLTQVMRQAVQNDDDDLLESICEALLKIQDEQTVSLTFFNSTINSLRNSIRALQDEDRNVRRHAAGLLNQKSGGELEVMSQVLYRVLSNDDSRAQENLAEAFVRIAEDHHEQTLSWYKQTLLQCLQSVPKVLEEIGSVPTVAALAQALRSENNLLRRFAAAALVNIGDEQAIPALAQTFHSEDHVVRDMAALILEQINDEQGLPILTEALKSESFFVQWSAVKALEKIESDHVIPVLIEALRSKHHLVQKIAARKLEHIGGEYVIAALSQILVRDLQDMVEQLEQSGSSPAFFQDIQSDEPSEQQPEKDVLEGIYNKQSIPDLIQALHFPSIAVREQAADALAEIGTDEVVDVLSQVLQEESLAVRSYAAIAMYKIASPRAVPALRQALLDEFPMVGIHAAMALEKIGGEQAVSALTNSLQSNCSDLVLIQVVQALEKIGGEQAVPVLIQTIQSSNPLLSNGAVIALGKIGGEQAVSALIGALQMTIYPMAQWSAIRALGQIGDEPAVSALLSVLRNHKLLGSEDAAKALAKLDVQMLANGLLQALAHEDSFVRRKAAEFIGYYVGKPALPNLARLLTDDPAPEVRQTATRAQQQLCRKLQHFDTPIRTTKTNASSLSSPPSPLTA